AVPAACPTCRGRVVGAEWYPWGGGSWSRYKVRRGDRAIRQLEHPLGGPELGRWRASGQRQGRRSESGGLCTPHEAGKEGKLVKKGSRLNFTPWQTWQRPTLPRLKTEYHRRWGVSRPSSEWDRVQPPRNNHQVGEGVKQTGLEAMPTPT